MSHPDEGVLQELLDGELPPADAAAVRAHLAGCVPCAVVLRDLGATQAEADAIVARLPLDPPLPVRVARPRRAMNLRLVGLAASGVLVAGTSWILLRSPSQTAALSSRAADSASGMVLPMPGEERQEVPATTPGAPPPAAARVDAGNGRIQKAREAPPELEADAVAEAPKAKVAAQAPGKVEVTDDGYRANEARRVTTPSPMAQLAAPPGAPAQLTAGAATATGTLTVAGAERRLGFKVYTIAGLTPMSVELLPLPGDSGRAVRQRYMAGSVPVVLVQETLDAGPRGRESPERRVVDSAGVRLASLTWRVGTNMFLMEGALPADSLEALLKRLE